MRPFRGFLLAALWSLVEGCTPPVPPPDPPLPAPPESPGPLLSDTPLWSLEEPERLRPSCFGTSVALGDVNGDGHADLLVAAPPCLGVTGPVRLALYAGNGSSFTSEPILAEVDWKNPTPSAQGRNVTVAMGDINGDRFADLLVRSRAGTLVFAGQEDLAAVLRTSVFHVPYTGPHYRAFLRDVDGDGLDELFCNQGSARRTSIYRPTPGGPAPFTLARTLPETAMTPVPVGDLDGDGAQDVLLSGTGGSRLLRGCAPEQPGTCEGGLSVTPSWTAPEVIAGFVPDQNGDGFPEAILGEVSQVRIHLARPQGGIAPEPLWGVLGDATYVGLAPQPVFPGDLDQDGTASEFLLSAAGRLYAFFPRAAISAELRPGWAWPRSDTVGPAFPGYVHYDAVAAGDLNADGHPDVIVGLAPPFDELAPSRAGRPGRVVAFGGGKVPTPQAPAPFLRTPVACGLTGVSGGKPDVMVDGDVIARSMYVERRHFAAEACEVAERCVGAPGDRKLLRFSVSIVNLGQGSVVIPPPDERPELYEFDVCHLHDHLVGFARYELVDPRNETVAVGRKQGFAMVDLVPYCGDAPPATYASDATQLLSPGWADVYVADYPCQWLDVTGVPDGTYTLRVGANVSGVIDEHNVLPNTTTVKVRLAGEHVEFIP